MAKNADYPHIDPPEILRVSAGTLVCVKPAGLLSEGNGADSLPRLLCEYLAEQGIPGSAFTVHRLDRSVGGVMVFALSEGAAAELSRQLARGELVKEYFAVVHGKPEVSEGVLTDLLFYDKTKNKSFTVKKPRRGVREAKLRFRTVSSTPDGSLSLIHIRLITGRTHQIRVQFSSRSMPLYGDARYGSQIRNGKIALRSSRIVFFDPSDRQFIDIKKAPPEEYPWNLFGAACDYEKYLTQGWQTNE